MSNARWCKDCQDYIPKLNFNEHQKQHNIGNPLIEHKQYTRTSERKEDYMICLLHQKKAPCSCNGKPFGYIRKSVMMQGVKGIVKEWFNIEKEDHSNFTNDIIEEKTMSGYRYFIKIAPHLPYGNRQIPIDMETKTVVIMGATIHLRI